MLFKDITIIDKNYFQKDHVDVFVKDKYIKKIVPTGCYEQLVNLDVGEVYDGSDKILIPGFYNCHCHLPMSLMRSIGEGLPLDQWLEKIVFPFEAKLEPQDIINGALLGAMELIESGCCSFSDMYFCTNHYGPEVYKTGLKANLGESMNSFDSHAKLENMPGWSNAQELLQDVKAGLYEDRIKVDLALHSEYTSCEPFILQFADKVKETGLILQVHVSETKKEVEECKQRHNGLNPVQYLNKCGLFEGEQKKILAHGVYLEQQDFPILEEHNVGVARCYSSNLKLGSGFSKTSRQLVDRSAFMLGTDGACSNNNLNMVEEAGLAFTIQPGVEDNPSVFGSDDILKMLSYNGALFQGRENCGYIDEGMRADIVVMDTKNINFCVTTTYSAVNSIIGSSSSSNICLNMIDGDIVYRDGEFSYIDKEKVIADANQSYKRIISSM